MNDKSYKSASNEHINRFKMAHSIGVAEYMRERAESYGLDPDAMYVVGLLHDIGYLGGRIGHEQRGADILYALGMRERFLNAVELHGKNFYEMETGQITPELVLTVEADLSVDARGYRVGFEERLADIGRRYGIGHIAYKTVLDNIRFIKMYQREHDVPKSFPKDNRTLSSKERQGEVSLQRATEGSTA